MGIDVTDFPESLIFSTVGLEVESIATTRQKRLTTSLFDGLPSTRPICFSNHHTTCHYLVVTLPLVSQHASEHYVRVSQHQA